MILHIHHLKDSYFALPPEKQAELMAGAVAFADKYLKNGKTKASFAFSDGKGSASIWEVVSSEEMMQLYMEYPLTPYIEAQMIPVVDISDAAKIMKEMAGKGKKTAKK
jgi:hypothetical protein